MIAVSAHYGLGSHGAFLSVDQIVNGQLMLIIGQFFVSFAMGLSKCAVAIFLMRIVVIKWQVGNITRYV